MKPLLQSETFVRIAAPLAVGVALLGIWEIGCRLGSIPVYLFPKPSDISLPGPACAQRADHLYFHNDICLATMKGPEKTI
ncbi:hypothetical protein [Bradyrhizobium sp. BWA-3-5]|uniref:hypothetical protein n=1 Tax=Bradyrhizobium sp. BWA-3-5 TaxID=3080013 RepID=UPI00293F6F6A|nr:hypothetical protein [Bradyrhizobium sp. BWA-3-5]WOH67836.1 hypothetical protein RX331_08920 [Bradyrhizobium sp. BWA-3-5]